MIIDAHCHIFSTMDGRVGRGVTRSLTNGMIQVGDEMPSRLLPPLNSETTFPPDTLLQFMDWCGIDRAVLLQGPLYGDLNDYLARTVSEWPDRFVGAAYVDPKARDARHQFLRAVEDLGFHILKFEMTTSTGLLSLYPDLRLDDDAMAWIWEEAASRKLTVVLDLGRPGSPSYQTGILRGIIDRHPNLQIVIAHLGQPPIANSKDTRLTGLWREQLLLGRHPNVTFDLSALPAYSQDEDFPFVTSQHFVREALRLVGPGKLMWGTDVPGLLGVSTYHQLRSWVESYCDFLTAEELSLIMGETAGRVYVDSAP